MSPAEKQAREEQADRKSGDAAGKRYNSLSSVAPSKDPRDDVRGQKGYAKGGRVKVRRFVGGGEADELEMVNSSEESQDIADKAKSDALEKRGEAMLDEMRDQENRRKASRPAVKNSARKNANYSNEGRGSKPSGSLADQIPRDKATPVSGEKVRGTELGRNISNTLSALGPGKLAGIGAIGMEMRGAKGAQDAYNKAKSAKRAEEMRPKADATKFSSAPKSTNKNPAKRTKKFDDAESNVEFKRGGSTSSRGDGIAQRGKTKGRMF
jgi:hypothetical protein